MRLKARRAKYILKLVTRTFLFLHFTCVECGKDVMSYFASSSSYSNTFLVSAFTISQNTVFCSAHALVLLQMKLCFLRPSRSAIYVLIKCVSTAKFPENCCISFSVDNMPALNIFLRLHAVENHLAPEVALFCGSWCLID